MLGRSRPSEGRQQGSQLAWLLVTLAVTAASLWLRLLWVSAISDDGLTFANASAVSAGRLPYRDFFLESPPGVVGLYGVVFKVAGISYLPGRLLTALSVLISVAVLWDLGRRIAAPSIAAVVAAAYGSLTATFLFFQPHHFWSMTLPYAMTWAVVRASLSERKESWSVAAGVLAGAALLSDQSSALPATAGLIASARFIGVRRAALPCLAGLLAVGLTTVGWAMETGVVGEMWRQAVVYPVTVFRELNPVAAPITPAAVVDLGPPVYSPLPFERLLVWLAGAAGSVIVIVAAAVVLVRRGLVPSAVGVAVVGAAGLDLSVLLARPTGPFLWMSAGLNLVLLAAALTRRPWAVLAPALIVLMSIPALADGQAVRDGCGPGSNGGRVVVNATGGTVCVEHDEAPSLRSAVAFGEQHRNAGVVYLAIITPAYTLAGDTPPVGYIWVAPDVVAPADLAKFEDQLSSPAVTWIVSAPRISSAQLHPGSSERAPDGRWALDVYVERHFDRVGQCGAWDLLRAKTAADQPAAPCS